MTWVIGEMGVDGKSPGANVKRFKDAQAAIRDVPEFKGNVALVKTDVFWDTEAEAVFKKGWRENLDEWNTPKWQKHDLVPGAATARLRILYGFVVCCRYESRWAYPALVGEARRPQTGDDPEMSDFKACTL